MGAHLNEDRLPNKGSGFALLRPKTNGQGNFSVASGHFALHLTDRPIKIIGRNGSTENVDEHN